MITRRSLLGTTAGAVGLFGWFGRIRFRPQRRLSGLVIQGDNARLVISRVENTFLATLEVGGAQAPLAIASDDETGVVFFNAGDFGRDLHVFVAVRWVGDGNWGVSIAHVTTFERQMIGKPSMIRYSSHPGPYEFAPYLTPAEQTVTPLYA